MTSEYARATLPYILWPFLLVINTPIIELAARLVPGFEVPESALR